MYCLDRLEKPDEEWDEAQSRVVPEYGGSLVYRQQDVQDTASLNELVEEIAAEKKQLNGLIAAAGILQVTSALDYKVEDVEKMLAINYTAVFMTAQAAAKAMMKYKTKGSILLIASMSGSIANKGMVAPVYNSSKAALIQLARNLAMEWSPMRDDGSGGIRVNCLSPGHIETPMVVEFLEERPETREKWENENMLGRLATTSEFKGAALFLISKASSFMTGSNLVLDGGHTAW